MVDTAFSVAVSTAEGSVAVAPRIARIFSYIWNCETYFNKLETELRKLEVEEIFDLQKVNFEESDSRAVPCRLQDLNLEVLPKLKHIWKKDPQAKLSFEELPMPESLSVSDCDSIEVIFDLQKVNFEESHSRPVTYRLQELYIRRLPKLKHIWKRDPQAELSFEELPMPESLSVMGCDSIEVIFDLQKVNFEESDSRAVTYRLQYLNLEWLPKLKHIWKKDPQAKLSFEELPMPELLSVSACDSIEVIFDLQKVNFEESYSRPVTYRLQELYIRRLPKLKHIWKRDPQAELSFEELPMPESLSVTGCDSIEVIFDLQKDKQLWGPNLKKSKPKPILQRDSVAADLVYQFC
ncbi:hypothetical protein Q3G72_021121 [Acer saccharum]|nr:hypothetical protein Q3G72_021121 [Acer saccharum]